MPMARSPSSESEYSRTVKPEPAQLRPDTVSIPTPNSPTSVAAIAVTIALVVSISPYSPPRHALGALSVWAHWCHSLSSVPAMRFSAESTTNAGSFWCTRLRRSQMSDACGRRCKNEVMLSPSEKDELDKLRQSVYGPAATDVDAATLDRLAELEATARARLHPTPGPDPDPDPLGASQADMATASSATSAVESSATDNSEKPQRYRRWPILVVAAGSFAVGVLAGAQSEWLVAAPATVENAGTVIPLSADQEESYRHVIASQRWDHPEQVHALGSAEKTHAWLGTMSDGDEYCVAIDELATIMLSCQDASDQESYPLLFDWTSPISGVSLHLKVDDGGASFATMKGPQASVDETDSRQ